MTFMTAECFLDANVLVYAVSNAPGEADKRAGDRHYLEGGKRRTLFEPLKSMHQS